MAYTIRYSPETEKHLRVLGRHEQVLVLDGVARQLAHEPLVATRNRKPMRPNPVAPWELRLGRLRVYYDVSEANQTVSIIAVGVKDRSRVVIGGEVVEL